VVPIESTDVAKTIPVRLIEPNQKRANNNDNNRAHRNAADVPTSCIVNFESAEFAAMTGQQKELQQLESAALKQLYDALRRNPTNADMNDNGSIDSDDYERYVDAVMNNAHMIQFSCPENDLMGFFVSTTHSARRKCADNRSGRMSDRSSKNATPSLNVGKIVEEISSKKRIPEDSVKGPTFATNEETQLTSGAANPRDPETGSSTQQLSIPNLESRNVHSAMLNPSSNTKFNDTDTSNHGSHAIHSSSVVDY
jgi:hypothetical protein